MTVKQAANTNDLPEKMSKITGFFILFHEPKRFSNEYSLWAGFASAVPTYDGSKRIVLQNFLTVFRAAMRS